MRSANTTTLQSGCTLHSNESRVIIRLPTDNTNLHGWNFLSSAIYNGGMRHFATTKGCGVINIQVPASYDGVHPLPAELIQGAIQKDDNVQLDADAAIGMMTAAHMKTLRTASRSSGQVVVDAVVTAGISNARAAGADADYFFFQSDVKKSHGKKQPTPGTINTVVIINRPLSESALVEAYAIAIEAKCAACLDLKVTCAKSGQVAQGTGTDCIVLICPSAPATCNKIHHNGTFSNESLGDHDIIEYAGKHTLLGEFVGQAVKQSVREAIICNIRELYGSVWRYHFHSYRKWLKHLIICGAQPFVPPCPMMPVPSAPTEDLVLGVTLIAMFYSSNMILQKRATILLAAAAWDRYLPSVPLAIHPVVLVGKVINITTQKIPKRVYRSPILGLLGGIMFLLGILSLFTFGGHVYMQSVRKITGLFIRIIHKQCDGSCRNNPSIKMVGDFLPWISEVALVETTFSLQLLCTIALQMSRFLERSQIDAARNQLSWLCSRDPLTLNKEELAGATLESLSENLSDGTIGPWFYYILFGPLGALTYRVVNTLDSRIGYRGGQYEWFGKASARCDDLINLIPARITALALCLAAHITSIENCCAKTGMVTAWKDCRQCSSPNAGWPMAAMAGILGLHLEKKGEYCLGKSLSLARDPGPNDILAGHKITQAAGGITLLASVVTITVINM